MDAVDRVLDHLDTADPGGVLGVYRYGSSVLGGLRPDSDVDLLVVTERSLDPGSGGPWWESCSRSRDGGPPSSRAAAGGDLRGPLRRRSVEVPPVCDLQYGEWLRTRSPRLGRPHLTSAPTSPCF